MVQFPHRLVLDEWWRRTRRYALYSTLASGCLLSPGVAGERFGQWSLEFQDEGVVALKLKPLTWLNGAPTMPELVFVCNQVSKYIVVIVTPSPGTFKNHQEVVSIAIQRSESGYEPSDLLQQWDNEGDYIFSERPDGEEQLTSYLKARETEGVESVHLYFPNDLVTGAGTINHLVIRLSGFSDGMQRFVKECNRAQ